MSVTVGSGDFAYRVQPGWGQLPDGWDYGDVGGVGIDAKDRVYVFMICGGHPMIVLDRDGNSSRCSWGDGVLPAPTRGAHGPG